MSFIKLAYPLHTKPSIDIPFGIDFGNDPIKKDFYKLFDNKHCGVDFVAKIGTPVYASISGIVVRKEGHVGMGKVIGIRNGNIVTLYAHLEKFIAKLGQIVVAGDLIGQTGNTGNATLSPHLHFEIRDITKPTLKEMVFNPPFGKNITNYKNVFEYKVKNTNTQKTLASLSKLYFGNDKFWRKIKSSNPSLDSCNKFTKLPENIFVLIPNYSERNQK